MASKDIKINIVPTISTSAKNDLAKQIQQLFANSSIVGSASVNSNDKLALSFNKIGDSAKAAGQEVQTFASRVGFSASRLASYAIPSLVFFKLSEGIRSAVTQIVEMDKATNKLSQSLGGNLVLANQVSTVAVKIGAAYGQAGDASVKLASDLSRTGLYKTTQDLQKAVDLFSSAKLTEGFSDIGDHVEDITALLSNFNKTANDSAKLFDVIAKVGSKSGSTAGELINATRFAGPSFSQLNGSPEDFIALIGGVKELTRRTTTSVSAGAQSLFTDLLKPNNLALINRITGGQVYNQNGQLKDPISILTQIAKSTTGRSANEYSGVIGALGGNGENSIVLALLNDLRKGKDSVVNQYIGAANGASGTVAQNAQNAQDTIAVQLGKISATFSEAFKKIGDDPALRSAIKGFGELSQEIGKVLGVLAPLIPIVATLGAVRLGQYAFDNRAGFIGGIQRFAGGFGTNRGPSGLSTEISESIISKEAEYAKAVRRSNVSTYILEQRQNELNQLSGGFQDDFTKAYLLRKPNIQRQLLQSRIAELNSGGLYGAAAQTKAESDLSKGLLDPTDYKYKFGFKEYQRSRDRAERGVRDYTAQSEFDRDQVRVTQNIPGRLRTGYGIINERVNRLSESAQKYIPGAIGLVGSAGAGYLSTYFNDQVKDFRNSNGDPIKNARDIIEQNRTNREYSGALSGASTGAAIGLSAGFPGAAIGFVLGGLAGALMAVSSASQEAARSLSQLASQSTDPLKRSRYLRESLSEQNNLGPSFTSQYLQSFVGSYPLIGRGGILSSSLTDTDKSRRENEANYLGSSEYLQYNGSETGLLSDRIRKRYAQGGNLGGIIEGELGTERNNSPYNAKGLEEVNDRYAQDLRDSTTELRQNLEKAGKDIQKFSEQVGSSFEIFLNNFRQGNQDLGTRNLGRGINSGLLNQGFNILKGQGFQISGNIGEYLNSSLQSTINNTQLLGGDPNKTRLGINRINSAVQDNFGGFLNPSEISKFQSLAKSQSFARDLILSGLNSSKGATLVDKEAGAPLAAEYGRLFTSNIDDFIKNNPNAIPKQDQDSVRKFGNAVAEQLGTKGGDFTGQNSSGILNETLKNLDPFALLLDRANKEIESFQIKLGNINSVIAAYNDLLNGQIQLQEKTVSINVSRIGQSRALGTTDLGALSLLNQIPLENTDVPSAIERLRRAGNAYSKAQSSVRLNEDGSINATGFSGSEDQKSKLADLAAAQQEVTAAQNDLGYATSQLNNKLTVTKEKFDILNKIVQENIESNRKIGSLGFGDQQRLRLRAGIGVGLEQGVINSFGKAGINSYEGFLNLPEGPQKAAIAAQLKQLGGNQLFKSLVPDLDTIGSRVSSQFPGIKIGDITRAGLAYNGQNVGIAGTRDDTNKQFADLKSVFGESASIESLQLDTLYNIQQILQQGFASQLQARGIQIPDTLNYVNNPNLAYTPTVVAGGRSVTSTKVHDAPSTKTTHDVNIHTEAVVNVTGMENASKNMAIGATVIGVLDKMQSLLSREGDVISSNLAKLFKNASTSIHSQLISGETSLFTGASKETSVLK